MPWCAPSWRRTPAGSLAGLLALRACVGYASQARDALGPSVGDASRARCPRPGLPTGEIQEGRGGALRCLAPTGQELGTLRRHHAGRCIFVGKYAYIMNASSSEERWPELRGTWATVVASFAATA